MTMENRAGFATFSTTFGAGPRAALMIHCSLAQGMAWAPLAGHLSQTLTMTAFDMPGHGRSAPWDDRAEYQGLTTQIAASFCADGPRDVIGHSFGATVALRLAKEHPEMVRSLTLIEPVWFSLALNARPELRALDDALSIPLAEAFAKGDRTEAARLFTNTWGDGTPWEALPASHRARLAGQIHLIPAGAVALYDDPGQMGAPGALEQITCPTLLIEGQHAHPLVRAIHDELARRLPHTTRCTIANAGHMAPLTHPQEVAAQLLTFLETP